MKIAVYSSKPHDRDTLKSDRHSLTFLEPRLTPETAPLARDYEGVCLFVHDDASRRSLEILGAEGCRLVALRCAGFNNVDVAAAKENGIAVCRAPAYSPDGVAEHAAGLALTLNRRLHRAYNRVREGDFSLRGLMGFTMRGKTVGVVGAGKIGECFARIMIGFGCSVVYYDMRESETLNKAGARRVELAELLKLSDIVSLHCPLTPETERLIDAAALAQMKPGVMLINTSRGKLVCTRAVIDALKSGQLGSLGLDVYEEEEGVFFEDLSDRIIPDERLAVLTSFPNVILTSHQGFFTQEAVQNIASATLENLDAFEDSGKCAHPV